MRKQSQTNILTLIFPPNNHNPLAKTSNIRPQSLQRSELSQSPAQISPSVAAFFTSHKTLRRPSPPDLPAAAAGADARASLRKRWSMRSPIRRPLNPVESMVRRTCPVTAAARGAARESSRAAMGGGDGGGGNLRERHWGQWCVEKTSLGVGLR